MQHMENQAVGHDKKKKNLFYGWTDPQSGVGRLRLIFLFVSGNKNDPKTQNFGKNQTFSRKILEKYSGLFKKKKKKKISKKF